jgi:endonuclease/exonuclease/phosphatase family metal-dependent hydrolase
MTATLKVATFNIHKGFSTTRRLAIATTRERLAELDCDLIFLQEVQGAHALRSARLLDYPREPQHEFLAGHPHAVALYGKNAQYRHGHHGNAILARGRLLSHENIDISHHRLERRGLLHAQIALPQGRAVHAVCTHLGLFARSRDAQLGWIVAALAERIPPQAPLILAGDFNDWRQAASRVLATHLQLHDVHEIAHGKPALTYPAALPVMALDRIYVRGFEVREARAHHGRRWAAVSDHAALSAVLALT